MNKAYQIELLSRFLENFSQELLELLNLQADLQHINFYDKAKELHDGLSLTDGVKPEGS